MTEYDTRLDEIQTISEERPPQCEDIGGVAGSGKTYGVMQAVAQDPQYGILCSTTGVSAVNLGATTVHSLLHFFDTPSARDWYLSGGMVRILHVLARDYRRLIIDEKSMLDAQLLDILYRAVGEANRFRDVAQPMGITLVGDFAQLPPVRAKWAFEAECWPEFKSTVLTKVWRQADPQFIDALNLVRKGSGGLAAEMLTGLGATWHTQLDTEFDGTTILPKNDMVSRYNALALDRLPGQKITVAARRWGQQRSEWGENKRTHEWGIPLKLELKLGAYVMLLANRPDGNGSFDYVNGDCGKVVEYYVPQGSSEPHIEVELVRTGECVCVGRIVRSVDAPNRPDGWLGKTLGRQKDTGQYLPEPHWRQRARRFVTGQIEYFPLRLAYASSVHKSQSLTLDRVQCDFRDRFFSMPAMLYVALSRARTLGGLRLVGSPERFTKNCNIDPRVASWL